MDEDAYDMAVAYTKAEDFIEVRDYNAKGGKVNMCKALEDWAAEERAEGRLEGKLEGKLEGIRGMILDNLEENVPIERIMAKLHKYFGMEEEEAGRLINTYVNEIGNLAVL